MDYDRSQFRQLDYLEIEISEHSCLHFPFYQQSKIQALMQLALKYSV